MGKIKLLDENLINKIAAGEVIERPASVVKELIENALDAGAKKIVIELENGGMDLIRIVDDGCGMDREDSKLAFERHATSKIGKFDDLEKLRTLGFRGEALPSIASVAQVTLTTKERGSPSPEGTKLEIRSNAVFSAIDVGCREGTIVEVRSLFADIPARRKYLKSAPIEESFAIEMITKEALAHPEVAFVVTTDGKEAMNVPHSDLRNRIVAIYGRSAGRALLPLSHNSADGTIKVEGYITKPEASRSSQAYISVFVNGRAIVSRTVNNAIKEVYSQHTAKSKWPIAVINLYVPTEFVDVNVHPAKTHVKFLDEKRIYDAVVDAVRAAFESPALSLEERIRHASAKRLPSIEPAHSEWNASVASMPKSETNAAQKATKPAISTHEKTPIVPESEKAILSPKLDAVQSILEGAPVSGVPTLAEGTVNAARFPKFDLSILAQAHDMYIIAEYTDGLVLIDQHAAHERIMYERFKQKYSDATIEKQELISPLRLELSAREASILSSSLDILAKLGFAIEHFGGNDYIVRAVPVMLGKTLEKELLYGLIEDISQERSRGLENIKEAIIQRLACRAADKSGKVFQCAEMKSLLDELLAMKNPFACAHGRPTMIVIPFSELEKRFERK